MTRNHICWIVDSEANFWRYYQVDVGDQAPDHTADMRALAPRDTMIVVPVDTTSATPVLAHLMFRSAHGSLTLAGVWMVGIGVFMLAASVANLAGGPWKRLAEQIPRVLRVAWGSLSLLAGAFFIVWPFLASPGVLY
jgi:hypothetical protein